MKKSLLALAMLGGFTINSFAQTNDKGKFSVGFEAGPPVGYITKTHNVALGGSLKYELPVAKAIALTLSAGYTSFQGKMLTYVYGDAIGMLPAPSINAIPVKGGILFKLPSSFYAEAQAGAAFGTKGDSKTAFAYSPGVGYTVNEKLDLGVRYEGWYYYDGGTISQLAARLALSF